MDTLFYVLERVYLMTAIPARCFDKQGGALLFSKGYKAEQDPVKKNKTLFAEKARQNSLPFLEFEDGVFIWGIMKDAEERIVILGPVSGKRPDKESVRRYALNHGITEDGFFIKTRGLVEISAALTFVFFSATGKALTEHDILSGNRAEDTMVGDNVYENYIMENTDEETERFSYSYERDFLQKIKEGNVGQIKEIEGDKHLDRVGKMAKSPLKQMEYMVCSAINIVLRTAIEAGLDAERGYSTADLYFQRLELCKTEKDMLKLHFDMKLKFAKLIKEAKETRSKSSYVEKCKVYISNHLNKPFSINEIANEIGINKSYLSRQFTKEMNMTIKRYSLMKRIDAAANMLRFSKKSIAEIADNFCFTSQSHFGTIFKQFKDTTPQSFREKEKLIDVK